MWFKVGIPYFTQMIWNIIFSCTCWKCSYFLPPATTKRIDYKTKQYTDFYKTCLSWWLLLWFNFKVNLIRTQSWFYISRLKIRNILVLNYLWILALFIICGVLVRSSFMTKHINTLIYVFMYVYKIQICTYIWICTYYIHIYVATYFGFTWFWIKMIYSAALYGLIMPYCLIVLNFVIFYIEKGLLNGILTWSDIYYNV